MTLNTETGLMTIVVPFGGFYESTHDAALDDALTQAMDWAGRGEPDEHAFTDEQVQAVQDAVDWQKAHEDYARRYAEGFVTELEALGLKLDLTFEKLYSPRFYNFETDRIFCHIPLEDARKLVAAVGENDLGRTLLELFTPHSGFLPHYSNQLAEWQALKVEEMDHNHLHTYLLAYLHGQGTDADEMETEVYDTINGISPSAADMALEVGLGDEGNALINAGYERYAARQKSLGLTA